MWSYPRSSPATSSGTQSPGTSSSGPGVRPAAGAPASASGNVLPVATNTSVAWLG